MEKLKKWIVEFEFFFKGKKQSEIIIGIKLCLKIKKLLCPPIISERKGQIKDFAGVSFLFRHKQVNKISEGLKQDLKKQKTKQF